MGHHDAVKRRLIEIATGERQPVPQGVSRLSADGASVSSLTRKYVRLVGIFAATCNAAQTRGLDPVTIESARQEPFMNIGHRPAITDARSRHVHARVSADSTSKPLSFRARNAIREAVRLDAAEAPGRELDQRKKEAAEASAAREKTRVTNKAAFRLWPPVPTSQRLTWL